MNSRAKYFCFTINNPSESELSDLQALEEDPNIEYLIFGLEGTQLERTVHYQGFVCFKKRCSAKRLKRDLGGRAHVEVTGARNLEKAAVYCKKEGNFSEYGILPKRDSGKGRRSDLLAIRDEIVSGASRREVSERYFSTWVIHRRAFGEYRSMLAPRRNTPSEVFVFWGSTGVGKTRRVVDAEPGLWISPDNSLTWFDGYEGQDAVLFDDFVGCPRGQIDFLLKMLDRYPMNVPIKGAFINWAPKRIYFTSNLPPEEWFPDLNPLRFAALLRRLKTVTEMTEFFGMEDDEKSQ